MAIKELGKVSGPFDKIITHRQASIGMMRFLQSLLEDSSIGLCIS